MKDSPDYQPLIFQPIEIQNSHKVDIDSLQICPTQDLLQVP